MLRRKGHRCIEANDVGATRHGEDLLDDRLACLRIEVVNLGGVFPRHICAVVPVIDVMQRIFCAALEGNGGVIAALISVFNADSDTWRTRKILAGVAIVLERRMCRGEEELRTFAHPAAIDRNVVGDHVGDDANANGAGPSAERCQSGIAAQRLINDVFGNRVGRTLSVGIASVDLHRTGGGATAPDANRPEGAHPASCEQLQLFIGDLVETADRRAVALGELRKPDEEMFCLNDDLAHPRGIVAVARWLWGAEGRLLSANHRNASDL